MIGKERLLTLIREALAAARGNEMGVVMQKLMTLEDLIVHS